MSSCLAAPTHRPRCGGGSGAPVDRVRAVGAAPLQPVRTRACQVACCVVQGERLRESEPGKWPLGQAVGAWCRTRGCGCGHQRILCCRPKTPTLCPGGRASNWGAWVRPHARRTDCYNVCPLPSLWTDSVTQAASNGCLVTPTPSTRPRHCAAALRLYSLRSSVAPPRRLLGGQPRCVSVSGADPSR